MENEWDKFRLHLDAQTSKRIVFNHSLTLVVSSGVSREETVGEGEGLSFEITLAVKIKGISKFP